MFVNLLATFGDRYGAGALARAQRDAEARGYRLVRTDGPAERLCAWIDWRFAPSWWSSEVRDGQAWYALTADGAIAGFAAFGSLTQPYPWLRAYRDRAGLGRFGPYGVAEEHRGTGVGEALLSAALSSLAERVPEALIPAVSGDRLIAAYQRRARARIVDHYEVRPRRARAVILASGNGTNAQAVIDAVSGGRTNLDLAAIVTNDPAAGVRVLARAAGVADEVRQWDRNAESRAEYDARLIAAVAHYEPDIVLLLGWMHLVPPAFLERFPETINVHPAFLPFDPACDDVVMPDGSRVPAFRGARAPESTIAAGVGWSGVSVHRVTAAADRGAILVRTPAQLEPSIALAALRSQLRPLEHAAVEKSIRRWGLERNE